MPEIDGYIVCSQLQGDPETAYIPVIFLTALDSKADRTKAFAVGGGLSCKTGPQKYFTGQNRRAAQDEAPLEEIKRGCHLGGWNCASGEFLRFKQSLIDRL